MLNNLKEFRKLAPGGLIAPVLKSNAYGHGLIETARFFEKMKDIPFLIVDSYFEALALRRAGIKRQLLIIGYTSPEIIFTTSLRDIVFVITSLDTLRTLEGASDKIRIHLKIDTGMKRQGLLETEIDQALEEIANSDVIVLEGLCSHLSDADNEDPSFTEAQINVWNRICCKVKKMFPLMKYTHLSATEGHKFSKNIDANVSRLGIGLYGLIQGYKFTPRLRIIPVLKMKTIITGIKNIKRDDTVGYNNTFKAMKDMWIATIPVGYFEGLDRRLSNKGYVQVGVNKILCPIIGRISMNMASIDISNIANVKIGDEVIVISNNMSDKNSIISMAEMANTISYEIAVHIPAHLKREYIGE